jgi:hypothetical protein
MALISALYLRRQLRVGTPQAQAADNHLEQELSLPKTCLDGFGPPRSKRAGDAKELSAKLALPGINCASLGDYCIERSIATSFHASR